MAGLQGIQTAQTATTAAMVSGLCLVKTIVLSLSTGTGASVVFHDSTTNDNAVLTLIIGAAGTVSIDIPAGGMAFTTGVYAVLPANVSTTIFYEEQ